MKKLLCILMMLLFALPALAEESDNPFAPYVIAVPSGAVLEENEGTTTFVAGMTRVVTMVIARVPDDDPASAVLRMMGQFDPAAVLGEELPLAEGFVGLASLAKDRFGEGIDQHNVMILSRDGDLLILSAYDLEGDEDSVLALLDALLAALTVDGMPILPQD